MKRPKVAQVGCGYWGKNLARNFAELGALAAVVDWDPQTAATMAKSTGVRARSFDYVLADSSIEAVSIATPAETHFSLTKQALESGKHVYVEKPLALNLEDGEEIIAIANRLNRRLMVGHLLQYHPVFMKMKACVNEGMIGDLSYIYSNRMSLGKFRIEENVLWSFAPHDVSMLLSLAGSEPTTITAQAAAILTPGVEDWVTLQLQFAKGLRGHVQVSWLHPFKEQRLVAIGSEGMLVFEDSANDWSDKLKLYPHMIDTSGQSPTATAAEALRISVEKSEPLRDECMHFLNCVASGCSPRTDGNEGLRVLHVLRSAMACLSN